MGLRWIFAAVFYTVAPAISSKVHRFVSMTGTNAFLLMAAVTVVLRSCVNPCLWEGTPKHFPSKIDSVAICLDDHDSLKVWEVTDSLRDPKVRFPTTSTRIFQNFDYASWLSVNVDFSRTSDSLGVQRITKADFDGNGLTDLIVSIGGQPIIILDDGHNTYRTLPLTVGRGGFDATYLVLHCTNGQPEILCYYIPWFRCGEQSNFRLPFDQRDNPHMKVDTLVYYKGDFIEKNTHPAAYRIEHIHFISECSLAFCRFDLFIDSVGKATYVTHRYNEQISSWTDTLTATIDIHTLEDIYDKLCYIDFPRLLDNYVVNGGDYEDCSNNIVYDGGKIKTIQDYGEIGTRGLAQLYVLLSALRFNQQWVKVGESIHR